jgi:hypothetical protein
MVVSVRRARRGAAHPADRRRSGTGGTIALLLALALLSGCEVDGAAAPAGPPPVTATDGEGGPDGPDTPDGAAGPDGPDVPAGPDVPDGGVGGPEPEPAPTTRPDATDLASFLAGCERGIRDWRAAQVDYPAELSIEKGGTESYVAAVDAGDTPLDPGEAIPGPSPTGEAVFVRCEVAARLTPLGGALTVDEDDWIVRSFTPTGVIRWTWVVTAVEADDQDLELELQPAVRSEDGTILVGQSSTEISSFITGVRVEEDAVERVGEWWESRWAIIALVAAGIGAALLALLRFGAQLADQTRRTVAAFRGDAGEDDDDADPSPPGPG